MLYLGDFAEDATLDFKWSTNDTAGASITRGTNGTVSVYVGNSTTQLTTGVTDTEDFDSLTGIHHCRIDLSSSATYAAGSECQVVLSAATIDGETVNAVIAHFSIERAGGALALLKGANGLSAIKTQTAAIETDTQDLQSSVGTIAGYLDTEIAAIKAVTDNLPDAGALTSLATASALATVDSNVDSVLEDTGTTLPATLSTIAGYIDTEVAAVLAAVDTEVAAILADTNELQTDWVDGGRLDLILDGRASATALQTVDDELATVDSNVDAIKAKTDSLTFTTAGMVDSAVKRVGNTTLTASGTGGQGYGAA